MSDDWICTTILEYADRAEGQVIHRGLKKDCERTAEMISAISIGGRCEVPIASRVAILPAKDLELQAGELWAMRRPQAAPADLPEPPGEGSAR